MGNGNSGLITFALVLIIGFIAYTFATQTGLIEPFALGETAEQQAAVEEQAVTEDALGCYKGGDFSNTGTVGPQVRWLEPTESMAGVNAYVYEVAKNPTDGTYADFSATNKIGSKTDSATDTFGGENRLGIIYGYDNGTFYERFVSLEVPCKKFLTSQYDHGSNKLVKNATSGISIKVTSSDLGTVDTSPGDGTHNETLGAGEYGSWDIRIDTVEKEGISAGTDVAGNVFKQGYSVEFNKSLYDETTFSLPNLKKATLPSYYTEGQTDSYTVFYETDGCPSPTQESTTYCQVNLGTLKLATESGENPPGGGQQDAASIGRGDLRMCLHDQGIFVNTKSGAPGSGYEDNDGTAVGFLSGSGGNDNCWYVSVI